MDKKKLKAFLGVFSVAISVCALIYSIHVLRYVRQVHQEIQYISGPNETTAEMRPRPVVTYPPMPSWEPRYIYVDVETKRVYLLDADGNILRNWTSQMENWITAPIIEG